MGHGTASTATATSSLDQGSLVARAQDGDLAAFDELVQRYSSRLYRYAYSMLGNRQDAEDALQDTLVRVWRFLPELTSVDAFGAWTYRALTRQCFTLLARRRAQRTEAYAADSLAVLADGQRPGPGPTEEDPADHVVSRQRLEELTRLVHLLPPEQRACWLLREVQGHSYGQIAAVLGVPESTVRGRLARARERLAEGMTSWR
ncbi:hypothetical protein BKD30_03040 [Tersicoccus phoenicis]|uniref:RNA polymerase subunit sigma-70 n=1 Tax=Tersicoccus phoenicis TaxID=554083 RepID=A0A1R1LJC7_9MICC|nr:hypothetical protein BKD30_03040 [Tersicoccus phoenicis]